MIFVIDYRLAASSLRGMARYCREITIKLLPILPKEWKIILYVDKNKKKLRKFSEAFRGADGTRTRDPMRDRHVF